MSRVASEQHDLTFGSELFGSWLIQMHIGQAFEVARSEIQNVTKNKRRDVCCSLCRDVIERDAVHVVQDKGRAQFVAKKTDLDIVERKFACVTDKKTVSR